MGKLTGTHHGDAANDLFGFYIEKATQLEEMEQYFMAAVALALSVEAALLAYFLVEFSDDNGGELQIPDDVAFAGLIEAANDIDVLRAPIDMPSHVRDDDQKPKHVAKDVIDQIRKFRNLIHPAAALRRRYDPHTFTKNDLEEFKDMYESVTHSLLYNL